MTVLNAHAIRTEVAGSDSTADKFGSQNFLCDICLTPKPCRPKYIVWSLESRNPHRLSSPPVYVKMRIDRFPADIYFETRHELYFRPISCSTDADVLPG
jgi:hypothetical protein